MLLRAGPWYASSISVTAHEQRRLTFTFREPEYTQPQPLDPNSRPDSFDCTIPVQLPIVAGFIPSLPWGLPFRISIHCWQTPHLARPLDRTPNQDEVSLFEARVFVDGCCVAYVSTPLRSERGYIHILDGN